MEPTYYSDLDLEGLRDAAQGLSAGRQRVYEACVYYGRRSAGYNRLRDDESLDEIYTIVYTDAESYLYYRFYNHRHGYGQRDDINALDLAQFHQELRRSADRHAKAVYRSRQADQKVLTPLREDLPAPAQNNYEVEESIDYIRPLLVKALDTLDPVRYRELLSDTYRYSYSATEIMAKYEYPSIESVYTALSRARKAYGTRIYRMLLDELVYAKLSDEPQDQAKRKAIESYLRMMCQKEKEQGLAK